MIDFQPLFTYEQSTNIFTVRMTASGDIPAGAQLVFSYVSDSAPYAFSSAVTTEPTSKIGVIGRIDLDTMTPTGAQLRLYVDGADAFVEDVFIKIGRTASGTDSIDLIWIGDGNNRISGGGGDDVIVTGAGADRFYSGLGSDYMDGGAGIDTLSYLTKAIPIEGVIIDLSRNTASGGDAEGDIIRRFENVQGTHADDTLKGTAGDNLLNGYIGADSLYGGGGDDSLYGGGGLDRIEGQGGADKLIGGGNSRDTYVYRNVSDSTVDAAGRDTIVEWNKDRISLTYMDANTLVAGNQDFKFLGRAGFTGHGGEIRLSVDLENDFLKVAGDVDGDRIADFAITVLGITTLASTDFGL